MRKKNGFTLVELLAVIVVLALIMVIAIPSVMDAMNKAKKESFFMYVQSLNSKATNRYIQESDVDPEIASCVVYDIDDKDLDISNSGDYEGWVKVERIPVNSGYNSVSIDVQSSTPLQGVKYCVIKGSKCVPNTSFMVEEGSTKATVTRRIKEGQVMCVNYQYPSSGAINTSETTCKTYSEGTASNDSYDYKVEVTLTDKSYVVQDYPIVGEGKITKKDFYKVLDTNKSAPPLGDTKNPTKISSPRCSTEDAVTYKGITNRETSVVTTTKTTRKTCNATTTVSNQYSIRFNTYGGTKIDPIETCTTCSSGETLPIPRRDGYTFGGWYLDAAFTKPVSGVYVNNITTEEKLDSGGCRIGYKDVNLYAKWNSNETTTTTKGTQIVDPNSTTTRGSIEVTQSTTTERPTNTVTTTTTNKDKTDYSLLLKTLSVGGYDLGFDSFTYTYALNVPNSQTSLSLNYEAMQPENVQVSVIGNENLNVGTNHVNVEVFNIYTGKRLMYNIYVKRFGANEVFDPNPTKPIAPPISDPNAPDPTLEESNAQLKSLLVSGYILKFDPAVYEYDLEITDEENLNVSYTTASSRATVVVTGNENIKEGSVIEVYVQSQNGYYNKTYKINLKRNVPVSNSTKVLRIVVIGLAATLIILLIITAMNKKKGSRIVKKKVDQPYTSTTTGEN